MPALKRPAALGALAGSTFIFAAQLIRFPSPLQDAATGRFLPEYSLHYPRAYLLLQPFSAFADMITYNSARQDVVLVVYLLIGYWVLRAFILWKRKLAVSWLSEISLYVAYLAVVIAYLAWAILFPRPCARLALPSPDLLALDFHSHTNYSWDARRSFTPLANMRWHARMGFQAAFITDHNNTRGAWEARDLYLKGLAPAGYRPLIGEEVSLQDTHIGVLGNRFPIDNTLYNRNLDGVRRFLGDCEKLYGGLATLNLPEYWLHHWNRLELLMGWGPAGIEVANAVPKALDFPADKKDKIVGMAAQHALFMDGVSDNHGWAQANYVWNVMKIPGQASMNAGDLQAAVMKALREQKYSAVTVITRVKRAPGTGWALALDPILDLWTLTRTFTPLQAGITTLWLWLFVPLIRGISYLILSSGERL